MSDELDPQLQRLFAIASEPLADAQFQQRMMNHLHRARGWRGLPRSAWSAVLTVASGLATGLAAPLRVRIGMRHLLALLLGALMSGLALLSA
jgi:hypothetical protein